MVRVDGEVGDPGLEAMVKSVGDQGAVGKWDEWLWEEFRSAAGAGFLVRLRGGKLCA